MSKIKLSYFVLGLINAILASPTRLTKNELTQEWIIDTRDSSFAPLLADNNGQLIYVLFPNNGSVIRLESMTSHCQSHLLEPVKRPLQASCSKGGHVIVALVEQNATSLEENLSIYVFEDRHGCSSSRILINDIAGKAIPNQNISIVAHNDTFDVFLRDDECCEPAMICRRTYDFRGRPVNPGFKANRWTINPVKKNVAESGFIHGQSFPDGRCVVERLDEKLKVLRTREWSGIRIYATSHGWISVCSNQSWTNILLRTGILKDQPQLLRCSLLNTELHDLVDEIDVLIDHDARDLQLHNLPDGGFIVLWIGEAKYKLTNHRPMLMARIRIVDALGQVGQPIELLDHNVCEEHKIESIEVQHGLCFRVACATGVNVKCIVLDKDQLFGWWS